MKYIIELPEEVKEKFDKADDINFCFYDYNSFIGKAIRNGIPLEEEFEYLKADIRFRGYYDERIEDLIDEHIAELKGYKYEPDDWDSLANAERDH